LIFVCVAFLQRPCKQIRNITRIEFKAKTLLIICMDASDVKKFNREVPKPFLLQFCLQRRVASGNKNGPLSNTYVLSDSLLRRSHALGGLPHLSKRTLRILFHYNFCSNPNYHVCGHDQTTCFSGKADPKTCLIHLISELFLDTPTTPPQKPPQGTVLATWTLFSDTQISKA
jgi:hypothetical protein